VNLLLNEGLITEEMLTKAREETQRTGLSVEKALEKLGFIHDEDLVKVQAAALDIPYMDLVDYIVDTDLLGVIPENCARKYKLVPLFKIGDALTVGMVDPQDIVALDQVRRTTNIDNIEAVFISEKCFQKVLNSYGGIVGSIKEIVQSINNEKINVTEQRGLLEVAEEAPVIKLVNFMIAQAVKDRASDIHVEPEGEQVRVRHRVDGILRELTILPKNLQNAVISRIKVLSKMDIAEMRKPQDGRIRLIIENRDLDIRVSTFPTVHGENVVMRLLDKSSILLGLNKIGFSESELKNFNELIRRPNGVFFVTGPTGSGKTSTLYSALALINSIEKNIITIEDPVEFELPLIRQTQVNPKAGITFANGLRSILRQDPDVIMVGEVRDKETADVCIQAALTGHLVLSTLHTNDAPSALTRLMDMGVEPFLISSSLIGVLAQRLVRVICDKCKEETLPPAPVLKSLGMKEEGKFYRGKGCSKCNGSGYVGRMGIFELMVIDEAIRKMIDKKTSSDEIKKRALQNGMRTLRDDGLNKVRQGLTTLEEILRVTEVE